MRPPPLERDRRGCRFRLLRLRVVDPLLPLQKLEPDRGTHAPSSRIDFAMLGVNVSRLDERIDQGTVHVVDPEPHRVVGVDDEVVIPRLGRQDRPLPVDRELTGLHLLGIGAPFTEVEPDLRVDAFKIRPPAAKTAAPAPSAARSPFRILPAKPALLVPDPWATEAPDQVGDGILILPDGQPGILDPRRLVPLLRRTGIKRLVDIRGHLVRIGPDARSRVILGHRLGDQPGELRDRPIPGQGPLVLVTPLARRAMTRRALLAIDPLALFPVVFPGPNADRKHRETEHGHADQTGSSTARVRSKTLHRLADPDASEGSASSLTTSWRGRRSSRGVTTDKPRRQCWGEDRTRPFMRVTHSTNVLPDYSPAGKSLARRILPIPPSAAPLTSAPAPRSLSSVDAW